MATGMSESESNFELNDEIVLLQSLWRTEFHSPEILPYQEDLVESVKSLLDSQQVSLTIHLIKVAIHCIQKFSC